MFSYRLRNGIDRKAENISSRFFLRVLDAQHVTLKLFDVRTGFTYTRERYIKMLYNLSARARAFILPV